MDIYSGLPLNPAHWDADCQNGHYNDVNSSMFCVGFSHPRSLPVLQPVLFGSIEKSFSIFQILSR